MSEAPQEAPKERKYQNFHEYQETYKTDEQKRDEVCDVSFSNCTGSNLTFMFFFQLVSAITNKLGVQDEPLPQDLAEGVDSDEWVRCDVIMLTNYSFVSVMSFSHCRKIDSSSILQDRIHAILHLT